MTQAEMEDHPKVTERSRAIMEESSRRRSSDHAGVLCGFVWIFLY